MKKKLRLFGLISILAFSFNEGHTQITVDDPNGFCFFSTTFSESGTANSRPRYVAGDGSFIEWSGSRWEIRTTLNQLEYINNSNSATPPCSSFSTWTPQISCGADGGSLVTGASCSNMTLPVELINFEYKEIEKYILLNWRTASELNNEKFEVEESRDGRKFQKIGEVEGNGTTFEEQEYSFEVKNPRNGVSYYRLKQIDFDGQFEYSEVISINFRGKNGEVGEFYPNPSKSGLINLDYFAQNDDEITISVFDMTGKLLVNQVQSVLRGNNNLSFDLSELNAGIYIVKIGDERNPTHRKLIIEK